MFTGRKLLPWFGGVTVGFAVGYNSRDGFDGTLNFLQHIHSATALKPTKLVRNPEVVVAYKLTGFGSKLE